jgi:hypothetical protein
MERRKETFVQKARIVVVFVLVLGLSPLIIILLLVLFLRWTCLYLAIWLVWLPRGKNVLFVYSDSPIWRDFMTTRILPLLRERAMVLNWSERKKWQRWSLAVQAFRVFGGEYNFNPLVVVFRPMRLAKKFRFWAAFKEWKWGDKEPVENLRREIISYLAILPPPERASQTNGNYS